MWLINYLFTHLMMLLTHFINGYITVKNILKRKHLKSSQSMIDQHLKTQSVIDQHPKSSVSD